MNAEMKLEGIKEAIAGLEGLKAGKQRKYVRRGVTKAGRLLAKDVKQRARAIKQTGLLALSIGSKTWTARDKSAIGVSIGPRTGFRRAIVKKKRGGFKVLSKKKSAEATGKQTWRDPTKYGHIVELGSRRTAAKPFIRPAVAAKEREAGDKVIEEVNIGVTMEWEKHHG